MTKPKAKKPAKGTEKKKPSSTPAHKIKVPKSETIIKKLPYSFLRELSKDEKMNRGQKLANLMQEYRQIEMDKKESMSGYKKALDEKKAVIERIGHEVSTGRENTHESCEVEFDFQKGERIYYFEGLVVGRERMSAEDHQQDIPFDPPAMPEGKRKPPFELWSQLPPEQDDAGVNTDTGELKGGLPDMDAF